MAHRLWRAGGQWVGRALRTARMALMALVVAAGLGACASDDGRRLPPPAAPPTTRPTVGGASAPAAVSGGGSGSGSAPGSAAGASGATVAGAAASATIQVRLAGGVPEGGVRRQSVARGQTVRIVIDSDQPVEAVLRGYERRVSVAAGRPTALELSAVSPGVFDLQVSGDSRTIFELEVR